MSLREDLDRLVTTAGVISQGVNALRIMALGLSSAKDPYAKGFNALHDYLYDADQELHKYLDACWDALRLQ